MMAILVPIELQMARGLIESVRLDVRKWLARHAAHERSRPDDGAVVCDEARGFHDVSLGVVQWAPERDGAEQ